MRTFLLCYNVETSDPQRPGILENFLDTAARLHKEMEAPCTIFVLGRALAENPDMFRRMRDNYGELIDIQQSTYSGAPLKTICQENHRGITIFKGIPVEKCVEEIQRAADVMERYLGIKPVGFGGSAGFYRGFCDRPDILEILHGQGIRFTRTFTRNSKDWYPVAFDVQPFRYEAQGFSDMLEIPGQGWSDSALKHAMGRAELDRYAEHMKRDLDYVAAKQLTWSWMQNDFAALIGDENMDATRTILAYARKLNFNIQSHKTYYEQAARPGR